MARHRKTELPQEDEPGLDISSLIDCTFLLLIYFLVCTTVQKRETDLGMTLPSALPASDSMPDIDPKLIRIDGDGVISVGAGEAQVTMDTDSSVREVPLLTADLRTYAAALKASNQEPLVQIYVDGAASQQRVIDVLNALAGVEITKVTFTSVTDP